MVELQELRFQTKKRIVPGPGKKETAKKSAKGRGMSVVLPGTGYVIPVCQKIFIWLDVLYNYIFLYI